MENRSETQDLCMRFSFFFQIWIKNPFSDTPQKIKAKTTSLDSKFHIYDEHKINQILKKRQLNLLDFSHLIHSKNKQHKSVYEKNAEIQPILDKKVYDERKLKQQDLQYWSRVSNSKKMSNLYSKPSNRYKQPTIRAVGRIFRMKIFDVSGCTKNFTPSKKLPV